MMNHLLWARYETGARTAMPIFRNFVKNAVKKEKARPFKIPEKITMMLVVILE